MAVSIDVYGHTIRLLLTAGVDVTALKVELLSNSAAFNTSHVLKTSVDNAGAYEISGNGWTTGGILMTGVTFTTSAIDDAAADDCIIDANDVSVTASGGSIGPAYKALIYDSTTMKPLFLVTFGQVQTAGDTTPFKIVWPANGIFNFIV